jgi:hypothetical protein
MQQLSNNMASISKPISEALLKKLELFYKEEVKDLNLPW